MFLRIDNWLGRFGSDLTEPAPAMEPSRKVRFLVWWHERGEGLAFRIVLLVLLLLLGFLALRDHEKSKQPTPKTVDFVAKVNGTAIDREAFESYLRAAYGDAALTALIDQELIKQAAKAADVSLTPEQLRRLSESFRDDPQILPKRALAEAEFLAQNLVMSQQSEEELSSFYELFKEELLSFDLDLYHFESSESAKSFETALEQGRDPEEAAEEWAQSSQALNRLTRNQISAMGLPLQKVEVLKPSETLELPAPAGLYLLRLRQRNQTFPEVRPEIARIFFRGHRLDLMHQLRSSAKIESPYKLAEATPTPSPTPKAATPSQKERHRRPRLTR